MMSSGAPEPIAAAALERLPLVTLYLSERCNSRCITCDYWRHGVTDMSLDAVRRLVPDLRRLRTQVALISGGEPLLNPEWPEIAELLRCEGLKLWLLTSGLSLAKHARRVAALFEAITVSLDGTEPATYQAIRGLDAFDTVCAGMRAAVQAGSAVSMRVTLQRANYRQLPQFITLARVLGVQQVSFLAVDVANAHAFARRGDFTSGLALQPSDLPVLAAILDRLEREHAADFQSGLIADSMRKLRRIQQYFAAICGQAPYPEVRCNVFEYSAVIGASGRVSPCFFIAGPEESGARDGLEAILNQDSMSALRERIRAGARAECARCVCSLWRDPHERGVAHFLPRGPANA